MPNPKDMVQQEAPKAVAVAVSKNVMTEGMIWSYAVIAISLAWALLYLAG